MNRKLIYTTALAITTLIQTSCNQTTTASKDTTTTNTEKAVKKDSIVVENVKQSKTKEEIKALTEEISHKKTKEIGFDSGDYNGDNLLDYFVKTTQNGADDSQINTYYFYDSKQDKISKLKIKNGPKSIHNIQIKSIDLGSIKATVTLQFEAGDIGTFNQKVTTTINIEDSQIIFKSTDLPNLKKADERLNKDVDAAYKELEGGDELDEESQEM